MQELVDVTNRSIQLASQIRVELLVAIRFEKNAVLSTDDERSAAFAKLRIARTCSIRFYPNCRVCSRFPWMPTSGGTSTNQDELGSLQDKSGRDSGLALLNTNVRAKRLISGEIRGCVESVERMLRAVQARLHKQESENKVAADLAALRNTREIESLTSLVLVRVAQSVDLLHSHVDASKDAEMNQLDAAIAQKLTEADNALYAVRPLVDEADRIEIGQAIMDMQQLRKRFAEARRSVAHQ